jgi:prepilin-type N-terminal cleavage/methylation domain-containing protein
MSEGVSVTNQQAKLRNLGSERGFSVVELVMVIAVMAVVTAIAILAYLPSLQSARADDAMREVLDQLRQAREYSIANRRYVQITFPVVAIGGVTHYEIQMTERNDLTAGAGAVNPVLSTVPIETPIQFYLTPTLPDTPDAFGDSNAIEFGGVAGGPPAGMLFQSDGELVSAATFLPINGSVFLGFPGSTSQARAVTVLGTTGRVRGWRAPSVNGWVQF